MQSALDPTREAGGGGGVLPRPDTKSGGGCCPLQARYEKRGGGGGGGGVGGAVHLRPDTKSERGGGGLSGASGPIQKAGKGEGLFSRRGGVTIYERGGCNPQNPPPGSASGSLSRGRGWGVGWNKAEACPVGIYKSVPGRWRYNISLSRGTFMYCPG